MTGHPKRETPRGQSGPAEIEPREHQSFYEGGHQEWLPGSARECEECQMRRLEVMVRFPLADFNQIKRLGPVATGPSSTNPKVEKFWATGDPSVFAKPGALDYQPE